jgi:hypothetical protein
MMRTLTDSELDAVSGGATVSINATAAGFAGLTAGPGGSVVWGGTNPVSGAASDTLAFAAAGVTLSPLLAGQAPSLVFAL